MIKLLGKRFRARYVKHAGPNSLRRFLIHCQAYVEAVAREAELRENDEVLGLLDYEPLRRENSAIRLCFGLFEFALGIDLPDVVFKDPTFMDLYWAAADMVCWANVSAFIFLYSAYSKQSQDVYSYNMEQSKGLGGNNIVTVLMQDRGVSLQVAADLVGEHFKDLMDSFVAIKKTLPSWGSSIDAAVLSYVQAMEHWVIGNLVWSFETQRYFGPKHAEVKRTREVQLRSVEGLDE
jgi:hypothetical protein